MLRSLLISAAVAASAASAVWWARQRWMVIRVSGPSMEPTLHDGEQLIARRIGPAEAVARGDIVVVRKLGSHQHETVKRVLALPGETPGDGLAPVPPDQLWLEGDGTSSYDSRHAGPVPRTDVLARISRP